MLCVTVPETAPLTFLATSKRRTIPARSSTIAKCRQVSTVRLMELFYARLVIPRDYLDSVSQICKKLPIHRLRIRC